MPSLLAGSAIAQGPSVGKIAKWTEWNPPSIRTKWLLLAGASNPPREISISERRTRDTPGEKGGTFLHGVCDDLKNMEKAIGSNLFNLVRRLNLKKSEALHAILELFDECSKDKSKPILYYTGHGETGTGNWVFNDGTITLQDILRIRPSKSSHYPMIFSDACYSGQWANLCLRKGIRGFHCLAACPEYSTALDTEDEGGDLTLFITGKKPRPGTEPLYSLKNRNDFPITAGYDKGEYTAFVASHVSSSEDILISQSFHSGHLSCIFGSSKNYRPRPAVSYAILNHYDSFIELVQKKKTGKKSKHIYSLECDENLGFAAFFMEQYGTAQTILTNTSDVEKKMKDGFKITACTAHGSVFYVIMTKGTKDYKGKQEWFISDSWDEAKRLIQEKYKERRVVTGICYSTGQNKYLIVMMEILHDQIFRKFNRGADLKAWVKKEHTDNGFHPTIIFRDPKDEQTLVVMIKDGSDEPYSCTYDFKVVS